MIRHLGDLKREFHHVKVVTGEGRPQYEPTMVILKERQLGTSFMIRLKDYWRFADPVDDGKATQWDQEEFNKVAAQVLFKKQLNMPASEWAEESAAIVMAEAMYNDSRILQMTSFDLIRCLQMFHITVSGQSMAQLLMFIQDGLTELRKMKRHIPEDNLEIGEMLVDFNGRKTAVPLTLSETDLKVGVNH